MCQSCGRDRRQQGAIVAALCANLGIAVAKLVGFVITQSAGMLAEAIHSLADTGNQALLLLGGSRARKEATPTHPFGYGRERYFWSFAVSLVLFSIGGLFALYEGIDKLRHPHEIESVWVAVAILVFAIALETFSLRTAIKEVNHVRGEGVSYWRFIRTSKQPELPVVLLEDVGAELGPVRRARRDRHGRGHRRPTLGRGRVGRDRPAPDRDRDRADDRDEGAPGRRVREPGRSRRDRRRPAAGPGVREIVHLKTQHIGPDEILVAAKVEFDPALTFEQLSESIDATEVLVRRRPRRRG